jgi:hypothetical protein
MCISLKYTFLLLLYVGAGVALSVKCLTTDWTTGVRSPTKAEDFSSVFSQGVKRGSRGVMLTTHPHLVPRLRMSRSYTSSPPKRLHGV